MSRGFCGRRIEADLATKIAGLKVSRTPIALMAIVALTFNLLWVGCSEVTIQPLEPQPGSITPANSLSNGSAAITLALTGKIVYTNGGNLFSINLSSRSVTQLTFTNGEAEVNPEYSADGSKIAFQSSGIWTMNADGTGRLKLTTYGGVPEWSPDGTKIAFTSNGVLVMNSDGSNVTQLTTHGLFPAWSPDGTRIAFSSSLNSTDSEVWIMDAIGQNQQKVLSRAGADIDVSWSHGPKIAFGGSVAGKNSYEIFVVNPDGTGLTRLTVSAKQDFEPTWSPDGSMLAFASFRSPSGIYTMNADGSNQTFLTAGRQPSWAP